MMTEAQVSRGVSRQVTVRQDNHVQELEGGVQSIKDQLHYFLSPDPYCDDPGVRQVCIANRGSKLQYADVLIENIPARGVIDSGSDITIMGEELFSHVATVLCMRKSQFRKPDKVPKT